MDQPSEEHIEQGILKTIEAAGDVTVDLTIRQGGCGPAMVRGSLSIQQGGTQSALVAGPATIGSGAFVGLVASPKVTVEQGARVLIGTPGAFAAGAAVGALVAMVAGRRRRRSR
jgi:hypothetical protein